MSSPGTPSRRSGRSSRSSSVVPPSSLQQVNRKYRVPKECVLTLFSLPLVPVPVPAPLGRCRRSVFRPRAPAAAVLSVDGSPSWSPLVRVRGAIGDNGRRRDVHGRIRTRIRHGLGDRPQLAAQLRIHAVVRRKPQDPEVGLHRGRRGSQGDAHQDQVREGNLVGKTLKWLEIATCS
jgi:hypothetical protein